jgi:hypothetical protein
MLEPIDVNPELSYDVWQTYLFDCSLNDRVDDEMGFRDFDILLQVK